MEATDILDTEHRLIERLLNVVEIAANRLEQSQPLRADFFLDVVAFIQNFADAYHHSKEEKMLFTTMIECGFPAQGGPINVMLAEHEQARLYTQELQKATTQLVAGDETVKSTVIRTARDYALLLREHIVKEDTILFQMAFRLLSLSEQRQLGEKFRLAEEENTQTRTKYIALLNRLEDEVS